MVEPISLIVGGAQAASALAPFFRKSPKGPDIEGIIRDFMAARPEGYLTPGDIAQGERFRERGGRSIGELARTRRAFATRRFAARGLAGSPAQERVLGDIGAQEQTGRFDLNRAVEDFLQGRVSEREGFERQKILGAFGARLGGRRMEFERDLAREAAFFNSLEKFFPLLAQYFPSGGGPGEPATQEQIEPRA